MKPAILALILSSCTIQPTVVFRADGSRVASLGGSLATKSKSRALSITLPDGTKITSSGDNDETVAPRAWMWRGVASSAAPVLSKGIEALPNKP